jgi:hypothetical protein
MLPFRGGLHAELREVFLALARAADFREHAGDLPHPFYFDGRDADTAVILHPNLPGHCLAVKKSHIDELINQQYLEVSPRGDSFGITPLGLSLYAALLGPATPRGEETGDQ